MTPVSAKTTEQLDLPDQYHHDTLRQQNIATFLTLQLGQRLYAYNSWTQTCNVKYVNQSLKGEGEGWKFFFSGNKL